MILHSRVDADQCMLPASCCNAMNACSRAAIARVDFYGGARPPTRGGFQSFLATPIGDVPQVLPLVSGNALK
jgi:hypothetical protein